MSDEAVSTSAPESEPGKKQGFFSTQTGRIVAIVGGLVALGIVAGVAVAIVLNMMGGDTSGEVVVTTPPAGSTETTGSAAPTSTVEAAGPAAEVANAEVFTFRNIFEPLIKPLPEPTAPSTNTSATPDAETPDTANVLYLDGVITEDGVMKAQLRYNGTTHTLGPGEGISGTPWEVLRVSSTSVTMLYGDVQVTLAVGQGITK